MFTSAGVKDKRGVFAQQEADQADKLQRIQDLLISAGYFRARLNIEAFDKILGGMCWCITGSNVDVDIEFEDDLNLGQKINLAEKCCDAIKLMECPHPLAAFNISNSDYGKCYPVIDWLIKKLMESKSNRAEIVRRQGLFNYNRYFKKEPEQVEDDDAAAAADFVDDANNHHEIAFMREIVFNGKPKRVFLTNKNTEEVSFQDPKRVHQALREFNDLSANKVFENMLAQIAQLENDSSLQKGGGFGFTKIGGKAVSKPKRGGTMAGGGSTANKPRPSVANAAEGGANFAAAEEQDVSNADVINNVKNMLQQEKVADKAQAKPNAKVVSFDLNEGIVGTTYVASSSYTMTATSSGGRAGSVAAGTAGATAGAPAASAAERAANAASAAIAASAGGASGAGVTGDDPGADRSASAIQEQMFEQAKGELDEEITMIKRKTVAVKGDQLNQIFTENIEMIQENVNQFQTMEEEIIQNDPIALYQKEKENYDTEIEKLTARLEKQQVKQAEVTQLQNTVSEDLAQLKYEKEQYQQEINKVTAQQTQLDAKIEQSTVKEHEIMAVTALIEEKARLGDERTQLKKKCKEEKKRLDGELEKMKQRKEELQQEEHAAALKAIDDEYNEEHDKLLDKRKLLAVENRNVNIVQRKIENQPSKIEVTQFHKRLVELFENLNLKSEENRRYIMLYNTANETKKLFTQEKKYLGEINQSVRQCKQKKEKEQLKANVSSILGALQNNITKTNGQVKQLQDKNIEVNKVYNDSILQEKEHFIRLKEFEDECTRNDELRQMVDGQ